MLTARVRCRLGAVVLGGVLAGAALSAQAQSPPLPPSDALVAELHATAYRWCPWAATHRCSDCVIPLKDSAQGPATQQVLGLLRGKRGGTARIVAQQVDNHQLAFSVESEGPAGDYEGTILLGAGAPQLPVKLSVSVKHEVVLPLIVLTLGIWLALALKRYVGVIRGLWTLQQREAALALAFLASHGRFVAASRGQPYATFAIEPPFSTERTQLAATIEAIKKTSGLTIDTSQPTYKDLIQRFERLEKVAASWGTFAGRLARASEVNAAVSAAAAQLPPVVGDPEIALSADLSSRLAGRPFTELNEYERHEAELAPALAFAAGWLKMAERIVEASEWMATLEAQSAVGPAEKKDFEDARKNLGAAAQSLRRAQSPDDLETIRKQLEALEQTLGRIGSRPTGLRRDAAARLLRGFVRRTRLEMAGTADDDLSAAEAATQDPLVRLESYRERQRRWDRAMGVIAFAIALLTALQKFYLDKPFGSLGDYINLLLVGLATRAAVEAVATALDWYQAASASR